MGTQEAVCESKMRVQKTSSSSSCEQVGETVTVLGETGLLVNRREITSFNGPVPLGEYPINEDTNPEIVRKPADPQFVTYTQDVCQPFII